MHVRRLRRRRRKIEITDFFEPNACLPASSGSTVASHSMRVCQHASDPFAELLRPHVAVTMCLPVGMVLGVMAAVQHTRIIFVGCRSGHWRAQRPTPGQTALFWAENRVQRPPVGQAAKHCRLLRKGRGESQGPCSETTPEPRWSPLPVEPNTCGWRQAGPLRTCAAIPPHPSLLMHPCLNPNLRNNVGGAVCSAMHAEYSADGGAVESPTQSHLFGWSPLGPCGPLPLIPP